MADECEKFLKNLAELLPLAKEDSEDYSDEPENDAVLTSSKGCCFVCPGVKKTMGTEHLQAILRLCPNIV